MLKKIIPSTSMPCKRGRRAGALLHDLAHHLRERARRLGLHHLALLARLEPAGPCARRRSRHLLDQVRAASGCRRSRSRRRPSPSAAASPGAAPARSRRARCRPHRRPRGSCRAASRRRSRASRRGEVDRRLAVEAETLHVPEHRRSCRASRRPAPQTVLTEFVSAVVRVMGPNCSPPKFDSGTPPITLGDLPLTTDCRRVAPAVERRGRGHDLERRPRRVPALRRAVQDRRAGRAPQVAKRSRTVVGVEARDARHHPHAARLRLDRDHRSRPARRARRRRPAGPRGRAP